MTITKEEFLGYLDDKKTINIYRSEHYLWSQWQEMRKHYKINPPSPLILKYEDGTQKEIRYDDKTRRHPLNRPIIGRWHFKYKNDKGQYISLVFTERGFRTKWYWEICSGGTCSNCADAEELFDTRKEAEKRILELMSE